MNDKKYTINRNGREFCIREYDDNTAIVSTWSESQELSTKVSSLND